MLKPRTKGKIHTDYGIRQIKKWYFKNLNENFYKYKKEIRKDYNKIIKDFNKEIINLLLTEAFEFIMPERLGTLRVKKKKTKIKINPDGTLDTKALSVDWKSSKELKKKVFHINSHSDGYKFSYFWNKRGCNIKNNTIYCLKVVRQNSRKLAKIIKTDKKVNFYE